jgi:hypothetical protein
MNSSGQLVAKNYCPDHLLSRSLAKLTRRQGSRHQSGHSTGLASVIGAIYFIAMPDSAVDHRSIQYRGTHGETYDAAVWGPTYKIGKVHHPVCQGYHRASQVAANVVVQG